MDFELLTQKQDAALAALIRTSLEKNHLDIPGTAYFDESLDHLSEFYEKDPERRGYYVLLLDGRPVGGIGLAELDFIEGCCELQKLYLEESLQGKGTGYRMLSFIEDRAREFGYKKMYLETHTNLQAAIHIYEKAGYRLIERPREVVHSTMDHFYLKEL